MSQLNERKEMNDQFKREQKHWSQLVEKVQSTKTDDYETFKNEKTSKIEVQNDSVDNFMSPDQVFEISYESIFIPER